MKTAGATTEMMTADSTTAATTVRKLTTADQPLESVGTVVYQDTSEETVDDHEPNQPENRPFHTAVEQEA
jgi:hypothetical protein